MFERGKVACPVCSTKIRESFGHGSEITCGHCGGRFEVMGNQATRRAVFVDVDIRKVPNPLYLPKGSIRACVTMVIAFCSWILIFRGLKVPDYLFNLLLAVIGYYFAFRKSSAAAGSYFFEKNEKREEPLFLPHGFIRFFLIMGFIVSSAWLAIQGAKFTDGFTRFMVLLWGLVLGYIFGKMSSKVIGGKLYNVLNHLKGLAVLLASFALFLGLLAQTNTTPRGDTVCLLMAGFVSFYFGSKTG